MIAAVINAIRVLFGRDGHLPGCERFEIEYVGWQSEIARVWHCAAGCPVEARRRARERRELERWTGHR